MEGLRMSLPESITPQLIEALEMLLDHEPNEWCECHAAERASWKYAKETLAKAKGETP